MGILKKLFILFLIMFSLGELTRIQLASSVAITFTDISVFVLVSSWFIWKLKTKRYKKPKLFIPIIGFFTISLVSLLVNFFRLTPNEFFVSLLYPLRWFLYSGIYFVVADFDKEFKERVKYYLLIPIVILAAGGFIQYFLYPSLRNLYYLGWDEHLFRLFSSFLDPNFAGVVFAVGFILLLGIGFDLFKKRLNPRFLLIAILTLFDLAAVYLTYSRSALLALLAGVGVFLYFKLPKKVVFLALVLLVSVIFILPYSFKGEGTNFLRIASTGSRIESIDIALKVFSNNPVIGVGFNAYRYYQKSNGYLTGKNWELTHSGAGTDNSFLFVLVTEGVIGFFFFIFLLYKMFLLGKPFNNNSKIVFLSSLVAIIVSSLFINSLFYIFLMAWIWVLAGITDYT